MRKDHLKFIAAMGLYSSCGIIAKFIDLSSTQIVFLRTLLGSLLLAGIFFLSGKKPSRKASLRSRLLVIASGVVMAVDWLLVYEAYNRIGVSLGTVIGVYGPHHSLLHSRRCSLMRRSMRRRFLLYLWPSEARL